jgi:hypothetical protein
MALGCMLAVNGVIGLRVVRVTVSARAAKQVGMTLS